MNVKPKQACVFRGLSPSFCPQVSRAVEREEPGLVDELARTAMRDRLTSAMDSAITGAAAVVLPQNAHGIDPLATPRPITDRICSDNATGDTMIRLANPVRNVGLQILSGSPKRPYDFLKALPFLLP